MLNKLQKLFIALWLVFAIFCLASAVNEFLFVGNSGKGFMFLGISVAAYLMHRFRKKQYSNFNQE